jgi:hypothetical protein
MSFFWGNVFEYFKDRRYAAVFFGTLMILIGVLAAGGILYQVADNFHLLEEWPYMLPGIGLALVGLIGRAYFRMRAHRLNRYKSTPLSRDELAKARSKLLKR